MTTAEAAKTIRRTLAVLPAPNDRSEPVLLGIYEIDDHNARDAAAGILKEICPGGDEDEQPTRDDIELVDVTLYEMRADLPAGTEIYWSEKPLFVEFDGTGYEIAVRD